MKILRPILAWLEQHTIHPTEPRFILPIASGELFNRYLETVDDSQPTRILFLQILESQDRTISNEKDLVELIIDGILEFSEQSIYQR